MRQIASTLLIALLLLAGCAMIRTDSSSWDLTTWVRSAGGTITDLEWQQTVGDGAVTRTYLAGESISVKVTPEAGYFIANLTINGRLQTPADPTAPYTTTMKGPAAGSVLVTFLRVQSVLSATAGANGMVAPARIQTRLGRQSPVREFIFVPYDGYAVRDIKVPDHLLNTDYQLVNATTGMPATLPAATNARVKVSLFNVKGSTTLSGSFAVAGAYAGPTRTVLAGATVLLDGSASTGATSYSWRQTGGPATVTLSGAATPRATFVAPSKTGAYRFNLEINDGAGSSTTTVFVTDSIVAAARSQCQNCHDQQGVGTASRVFSKWSSAIHARAANAVTCYRCHLGAVSGGHPGPAASLLGKICENCHTIAGHPVEIGAKTCTSCHNPHSAAP